MTWLIPGGGGEGGWVIGETAAKRVNTHWHISQNWSRYFFKPQHDLFLSHTKWLLCQIISAALSLHKMENWKETYKSGLKEHTLPKCILSISGCWYSITLGPCPNNFFFSVLSFFSCSQWGKRVCGTAPMMAFFFFFQSTPPCLCGRSKCL